MSGGGSNCSTRRPKFESISKLPKPGKNENSQRADHPKNIVVLNDKIIASLLMKVPFKIHSETEVKYKYKLASNELKCEALLRQKFCIRT
jgi:hypothetical protein